MLINDITENAHGAPPPDPDARLYGIEVEYERVEDPPLMRDSGWNMVPDGSLRDSGMEFITPPVPMRTAVTSFRRLTRTAAHHEWRDTVRTGIHVHADMRDLTIEQVKGVLAAYGAFEPLFFKLVPEDREENVYCVPWYRAPDQARMVPYLARGPMDTERRSGVPLVKYSALYLRPLWNFGTIEFRHAPTWRDPALFRRWMCAINRMIEWGKDETPESVVEKCSQNPNLLVRDVFGWTMAHVQDPEAAMDDVHSLATVDEMIPYTYKLSDWTWEDREGALEGVGYHQEAMSGLDMAIPYPDDEMDEDHREYDEDYDEDREGEY